MDTAQLDAARETLAQGSKSFAAATRLFGPALRRDVTLLYTWCRHCDDVTDGQALGHGRLKTASASTLEALNNNSLLAARGHPSSELPYQALAEVCVRHAIPTEWIEDHLHGFALDVAQWNPDTLNDTLTYSYHVAGVVGMMMARIMGVRDTSTLARASDLGLAFQLTNISRDVVEDARAGRCYLPSDWMREAGLDVSELTDSSTHDRLFAPVKRLVQTAEPYYASARTGLRRLPPRAAWAIATALGVYRDIGRDLVRGGPGALRARQTTSRRRKIWRVLTGSAEVWQRRRQPAQPRIGLYTPTRLNVDSQSAA